MEKGRHIKKGGLSMCCCNGDNNSHEIYDNNSHDHKCECVCLHTYIKLYYTIKQVVEATSTKLRSNPQYGYTLIIYTSYTHTP